MSITTDPNDPSIKIIEPGGQQQSYLVLSDEERAKGFVRPVRTKYQHVGVRPKYPIRELTPEEHECYDQYGYVAYEEYPGNDNTITGRFWTKDMLSSGCQTITSMGLAIAETYARDPSFYGGTYCCGCGKHFRVGEDGEFVWVENGVPTDLRVGT